MAPQVSICVPTYNGEQYLAECLDSVLAQTMQDVEILLVDDGSSDGTVALAREYAHRDARVRIEQNPRNLGLVGNWNRCVELARGEWIKFAFQDDLLAPTCVERLLLAVKESGRIMAGCARDFRFAPGTPEPVRDRYHHNQALLHEVLSGDIDADRFCKIVLDRGMYNLLGEPTVVLLHRSAFARFGPFNEYMVYMVDAEYWNRVATAAGVAYVPEPLATFRVHGRSASAHYDGAGSVRARFDALVLRHDYAFHPAYANLRAVCRRSRPGRDLADRFWYAAYDLLIRQGLQTTVAGADPKTRDQIAELYAAYPRLHQARRRGLRFASRDLMIALAARARRMVGPARRVAARAGREGDLER